MKSSRSSNEVRTVVGDRSFQTNLRKMAAICTFRPPLGGGCLRLGIFRCATRRLRRLRSGESFHGGLKLLHRPIGESDCFTLVNQYVLEFFIAHPRKSCRRADFVLLDQQSGYVSCRL